MVQRPKERDALKKEEINLSDLKKDMRKW